MERQMDKKQHTKIERRCPRCRTKRANDHLDALRTSLIDANPMHTTNFVYGLRSALRAPEEDDCTPQTSAAADMTEAALEEHFMQQRTQRSNDEIEAITRQLSEADAKTRMAFAAAVSGALRAAEEEAPADHDRHTWTPDPSRRTRLPVRCRCGAEGWQTEEVLVDHGG